MIPRADFISSGGAIDFGRFIEEVLLSPSITTPLFNMAPGQANALSSIDVIFETELAGPEVVALNAIVAAHSGTPLPGSLVVFSTSHRIPVAIVGAQVVSFTDGTSAALVAMGLQQQRIARADGRLRTVHIHSTVGAFAVQVQCMVNGAPTGAGVTAPVPANITSVFTIPVSESVYAVGNLVGVVISALPPGAEALVELGWIED